MARGSFHDCVTTKLSELGQMSQAERDRMKAVLDEFDQRQQNYIDSGMDRDTAAGQAAADMGETVKADNEASQLRLIQQARVQARLAEMIDRNADSPKRNISMMLTLLDNSTHGYRKQFHSMLMDMIEQHGHRGWNPRRNTKGLDNIVRSLYGEITGDIKAAGFAKAVRETDSFISRAMENAGIRMGGNRKWRLPQKHDTARMTRAGMTTWVDDHLNSDWLDWDAMSKFNEDKPIPNDPAVKRAILEDVYRVIVSDGASKALERGNMTAKSFAARLASRRFLEYKDADSWLAANKKYGRGDTFQQIVEYTDQAARDLALITHFGTNPRNGMEFFRAYGGDVAEKLGNTDEFNKYMTNAFDPMMRIVDGETSAGHRFWAPFFASVRTTISGAFLGGTPLVSIPSDINTMAMTAKLNGMPAARVLARYAKMLNPFNEADRRIARRANAGAEGIVGSISASERFFGELNAPDWVNSIVGYTHRLSFLTQLTEAGRAASTVEFQGFVADNAGKTYDELPAQYQRSLEVYGITAREWDIMRATPIFNAEGIHITRFSDIFQREDLDFDTALDVFERFNTMMSSEVNRGIPSTNLETQALTQGGTASGTIPGEVTRSVAFLKSFPLTIVTRYIVRPLQLRANSKERAEQLALLVIGGTLAGAVAEQMRGILTTGIGAQDMTDPEFWGKAALRGGGMGIVGDFIFSDVNTFGGGLSEILTGPVFQFLNDTRNLTLGNAMQAFDPDEDMNFSAELLRYVNNYAPGTRVWWLRLIKERMLSDAIEEMVDPNVMARRRRQARSIQENTGAEHWWRPGEALPDSAPDLENALNFDR
jgi:hypothetical protein